MGKIKYLLASYFWLAAVVMLIAISLTFLSRTSDNGYAIAYIASLALIIFFPGAAISLLLTNLALLYYWRPNQFWKAMLILQFIAYILIAYLISDR